MGILVEHYNGAFPLWLSPTQVRVLPLSDKNVKYAEKIVSGLGLRMMCEEVSRRYDLDFLQFFYLEHVLVSAN